MNIKFVDITSTDKLILPALLYSPDSIIKKVAIFLHGNGDSGVFYNSEMCNALGAELVKKDIAFLALNNRGARYKKKLTVADSGPPGEEERVTGGVHYELIEDCVKDIDGSIDALENLGYSEFYLLGFSTGANKICVYDESSSKNRVSKYVHAGPGDDSGLFYNEIGEKKFNLALRYAKKYLRTNPLKVLPKYTGMNPFTAQSAYDILHPDAPYNTFPYYEATTKRLGRKELFKEYKNITKPMLVLFGENDEFTYTGGGTKKTIELLKSVTNKKALPKSEFKIIANTDHGFHGKELEMARHVAAWLA
jgi:pimeloyl-ACP methyl ester carboxylesterase